jgi:hypothetical protein
MYYNLNMKTKIIVGVLFGFAIGYSLFGFPLAIVWVVCGALLGSVFYGDKH